VRRGRVPTPSPLLFQTAECLIVDKTLFSHPTFFETKELFVTQVTNLAEAVEPDANVGVRTSEGAPSESPFRKTASYPALPKATDRPVHFNVGIERFCDSEQARFARCRFGARLDTPWENPFRAPSMRCGPGASSDP
jgi:hypothetical protein